MGGLKPITLRFGELVGDVLRGVLRVLGECPAQDLASKVQAVRSMASEGMEVEDIERSIRGH